MKDCRFSFSKAVVVFGTVSLFSACLDPSQKKYEGGGTPAVDCKKVQPTAQYPLSQSSPDYTTDISTLMNKCSGCHGTAGGVSLTTFDTVKANAPRSLSLMQAGRMPPAGRLPDADINLLQTWIGLGYPLKAGGNTTPLPTNTPTTNVGSSVTFLADIKPAMDLKCSTCHGQNAQIPLASFEQVKAKAVGVLTRITLASTNSKFMPKGGPAMSPDFVEKFKQWQATGFQYGTIPPATNPPPASPPYPGQPGTTGTTNVPPGC